ncbi:DUF2142 domain-containing protein [Microbacterium cremeum]|uniref:DUF2142 domain-containing protein n=1 Tax=Microbacterium cremeum TaxID=2782169 RepID=UPI001888E27A|nr:DUF2142 domain-containing protein [Microbacterium cremeum]
MAVVVTIASLLALWSVVTPPLSTVDEPAHFNSVLRLMQGGGWPPPETAPFVEGTFVALQEAGNPRRGTPALDELPAPEERSEIVPLDGPGLDGVRATDWMTQHPPTYYAIVAIALTALGGETWRWDQLVAGARLISVLFVTAGVVFALSAIRRVTSSSLAAIIGIAAVLAVPQFFNVLSLVTNDAFAVLVGSAMVYFLSCAMTASPGSRRQLIFSAGSGLLLGLALLTKGTMLAAAPAVVIGLLVVGFRQPSASWPRRLLPATVAATAAVIIGGWWWLRNLLVFGQLQSSRSGSGRTVVPFDNYDLFDFVRRASTQLVRTFWGSIRHALDFPTVVVLGLTTVFVAGVVLVLVRSPRRWIVVLLAIAPLLTVALISFHAWEVYWSTGRIVGIQGRYLFPAIAVYALVAALAWQVLVVPLDRSARALASGLTVVGTLGVAVYGVMFAFQTRWGSVGWRAMIDASAWPASAVLVLSVGWLAAGAATAGLAAFTAAHASGGVRAIGTGRETSTDAMASREYRGSPKIDDAHREDVGATNRDTGLT